MALGLDGAMCAVFGEEIAMTDIDVAETDAKQTRLNRWAGYGCVLVALALPLLASVAGITPAFDAGRRFGNLAMVYLLLAIVAFVATQKRSGFAKSYGTLGAGAILLICSATATLQSWHDQHDVHAAAQELSRALDEIKQAQEQPAQTAEVGSQSPEISTAIQPPKPSAAGPSKGMAALLHAIATHAKKSAAESQALDRKFQSIDLSDVLTPNNLTSAEGLSKSTVKIRQIEGLIAERNGWLQSVMSRGEAMIRNAPISDDEKRRALEGFEEKRPRTIRMYRDLDTAQKASMASISAMLDFAAQNINSMAVSDGQLLFETQAKLDQYNVLLQRIEQVAAAEENTVRNVAAMQQQAAREMEEDLAKLAK